MSNGYMPYSQQTYTGYSYPNNGQRMYMQPQQVQIPQQNIQQQQQPFQNIQQPQMQPAIPIMQQNMPFGYETQIQAVRLANEEEAKGFIVYPNHIAVFIDDEKGKVYLKTANQAGLSSMKCYKRESDEQPKEPSVKEEEPKIDFGQLVNKEQLKGLVTIEQYSQLAENYKFLEEQMRIMQKQLNSGRLNNGTGASK